MAVNKNFVVKNGIEVASNLIYGDSSLQKVGIGSTLPNSTLDVNGDLKVDNGAYISGVTTAVGALKVGAGGTALSVTDSDGFVGINTASPSYNVEVRRRAGAGLTAAYFDGQVKVDGKLISNDFETSGIATIGTADIGTADIDTATIAGAGLTSLRVSGLSTFVGVATFQSDVYIDGNLNVVGDIVYDEVTGRNIYISGISTFGTVQISSGIVTATSGIVTYYGDGSNLTGTATGLTATIGVGSEGTFIGAGVTQINFNSTSGTAIAVDAATAGIATVTITPGVSIGLVIALAG